MSSEQPVAGETIEQIAERYGQAWNDHDLEAICALHTEDVVLKLGGTGGAPPVEGLERVREIYGYLLAAWPDQHIETESIVIDGDLAFLTSTLSATLALPWKNGSEELTPNGEKISFALYDVLQFVDGKIRNKTSIIDGVAIREQLA